jgi:hypothetical protein
MVGLPVCPGSLLPTAHDKSFEKMNFYLIFLMIKRTKSEKL